MEEYLDGDFCIVCGEPIPEGRQICPKCQEKYFGADKEKTDEEEDI